MVPLSVTRVPTSNRYLQPLPQQPDLGSSDDLGAVSAGLSQPQLDLADPSAVLAEPTSTALGSLDRDSVELLLTAFLQHDMIDLQFKFRVQTNLRRLSVPTLIQIKPRFALYTYSKNLKAT